MSLCHYVVFLIINYISSSANGFTLEPTTEKPTSELTNEPSTFPTTSLPTSNPITSKPSATPTTSIPTTFTCKDHCDAFSVMIDNYITKGDEICISYKVSRLLSDGICSKSIKSLTLGLCHNDSEITDGKGINSIIQSLYIDNEEKNKYIRGTNDGIRLNIDIDQEASFEICLKDIFQINASVSNTVTFLRASNEFECNEVYLNGLPCIDVEKFTMMVLNDDTESNDEEVDEYDIVDANGKKNTFIGTYGRWVVLSVIIEVVSILAVIVYCYVINRKKKEINRVVAAHVEQAIELQTIRKNSGKRNKSVNKKGENVLSESDDDADDDADDDGDDGKMDTELNGNLEAQEVMLYYDSDDVAKKE